MHALVIPAPTKKQRAAFEAMLDSQVGMTWATTSEGYSLFMATDAHLAMVRLGCEILFVGRDWTLSERALTASVVVEETPVMVDGSVTFYQFAARLRAATGQVLNLGILDRVMKFTITDEGEFLFSIERSDYVETHSRYRVKSTRLVITYWTNKTGAWHKEEVAMLIEKAPDLLKYGKVLSPEEYWARRVAGAANVDWTRRDMQIALETEKIVRRLFK